MDKETNITLSSSTDRRRGIALIIVLGMLSVMMVLAVAFAISMRTERIVAGNHLEVVRSRQLVYAALARALRDIDQDLTRYNTEAYPAQWSTRTVNLGTRNAVNLYTGEVVNLLTKASLDCCGKFPSPGKVMDKSGGWMVDSNAYWSPGALDDPLLWPPNGVWVESSNDSGTVQNNTTNTITAQSDGGGPMDWGEWYRIRDPALPQWMPVGAGRIAYLIVNVSGLLDANFVGKTPEDRGVGSNVHDIVLSDLSDVVNADAFVQDRDQYTNVGLYETMFELKENNSGFVPTGPRNFHTYARAPSEIDGQLPALVSGTAGDLSGREADIKAAFERAHFAPDADVLAEILYANLIDYVDADSVPGSAVGSIDGPYVEMIPMINEVRITNEVTDTDGNLSGYLTVWIECAYPFVRSPGGQFELEFTVNVDAAALPPGVVFSPAMPFTFTSGQFMPVPESYTPFRFTFTVSGPNPGAGGLRYTVDIDARIRSSGSEVDRIPTLSLGILLPPVPTGGTVGTAVGRDVIDPRLNWTDQQWANNSPWHYYSTMGNINSNAILFLSNNQYGCDGDTRMHAANQPLRSLGELGYLFSPGQSYDRVPADLQPESNESYPWRTIRLYDYGNGQWDRVLDHFALEEGASFKGRVNPNSEVGEALRAVFDQMPLDSYPGGAATLLSWANTLYLADAIQACTWTNPVVRLSELGRRDVATNVFSTLGTNSVPSEIEKESFYRNSVELLHPRQNLFLILLAAQTVTDPERYGSVPRTDQRALAVVWRDPLPDSDGHHPCFVRWFTWLKK